MNTRTNLGEDEAWGKKHIQSYTKGQRRKEADGTWHLNLASGKRPGKKGNFSTRKREPEPQ